MKRKLIGFLLLVIIVVSVALSTGGFYYFFLTAQNEINVVQESVRIQIRKQLQIFDTLLNQNINLANKKMSKILPILEIVIKSPKSISEEQIQQLKIRYGLEDLSIFNLDGSIIISSKAQTESQTNFASYANSLNEEKSLLDILDDNKVFNICRADKRTDNKLLVLGYYKPKGRDFIIECSINIKDYISEIYSKEYKNYIFYGLFSIITDANQYVEDIGVIGFDKDSHWSFLYDDNAVDSNIIKAVRLHDRLEIMDKFQKLTVYSLLDIKDLKMTSIGRHQNVCTKVVYNFIPLYDTLRSTLIKGVLAILLFTGIIFLISARLIHKYVISRIIKINKSLIKIADGHYEDEIEISYSDELAEIAKNANNMQARIMMREIELEESRKNLEIKVEDRTKELSIKVKEQQESEIYIHELLKQIINAQEIEMHKISRELHDNVAQDLSSLNILISHLFVNEQQPSYELLEKHSNLVDLSKKVLRLIRNLSYTLHPSSIDQLGISGSISELATEFQENTNIEIRFSTVGMSDLSLDFSTKINIYRVVQEALNNVKNHSQSEKVSIKLIVSFPNIMIRIEDFGIGFDVKKRLTEARKEKRMGMRSMQERIEFLGGSMDIKSEINKGTKFLIKIPILEKN